MTYQLHLGDCIEGMRGLPDKSVDHVIADPPYSEHVHGNAVSTDAAGDVIDVDFGFGHLSDSARLQLAEQYARITKRWLLIFSDVESAHLWRLAGEAHGLEYARTCFWRRTNAQPQRTGDRPAAFCEAIICMHGRGKKRWNGGGKVGDYAHATVQGRDRKHPTQKPVALLRQLVADFTDPGELILDSHAGSGTTGAACLELGRRFIGWELDPKHHATASKRLAEASKQQPLFRVATTQEQERLPL